MFSSREQRYIEQTGLLKQEIRKQERDRYTDSEGGDQSIGSKEEEIKSRHLVSGE